MERKATMCIGGNLDYGTVSKEIWGQFPFQEALTRETQGESGNLQVDQWSGQVTSEPRSRAKVVVRDFDLLGQRGQKLTITIRKTWTFFEGTRDDDKHSRWLGSPAGSQGGFFYLRML
jgi:hypothetical protein